MNWKNTPVLVTGGAGFIGSHLVERLVELGARVRVLDQYNRDGSWGWLNESPVAGDIEMILGDLRDPDSVTTSVKGCEVVFHLGALIAIPYSYHAPHSYIDTNISGSLNVFQAAVAHGVRRVVHTSTSEVYGTATYVPIDESHPLQGQSPYSASKIGADMMADACHRSFGLPVTTLRPFNTFGPRQSARAVIPTIISQALAGEEVNLGSLTPTRDLTFVADTVEGFLRIAACDAAIGRTVNLGVGKEISIGDLANMILSLTGREAAINVEEARLRPQKSEVERLCSNNGLALELLGWQPQISLQDGLGQTIEWIRDNAHLFSTHRYVI